MADSDQLIRGREAFDLQAWGDAAAGLLAADQQRPLDLEDLERLAVATYLTGRYDESVDAWSRAYRAAEAAAGGVRAARCAFWLGMEYMMRGETAHGGGWLGRAQQLVEHAGGDCVERGYLLVPAGLQHLESGDPGGAFALFDQAATFGDRFQDHDLMTFGRLGRGLALILLGKVREGVAQLDEAMVAVIAGEVSPVVAGVVYCAVIEVCHRIFDLRRAQEWTTALKTWCDVQPGLAPYRGECMVYRAELLQLQGAWPDALAEAQRAAEWLRGNPTAGIAHYQEAELYRLRGEFSLAEQRYREAARLGHPPEPGLALLRLAQDQPGPAVAAIRRALGEATDVPARSRLLPACVEIMLAADDVAAAREAVDELVDVADVLGSPLLDAMAAHTLGAVLLREGDAEAALLALRRAWKGWQALDAPYDGARTRELLAHACRALGDVDGAEIERDAAAWEFERLGAAPALARVRGAGASPPDDAPGGLTARELEVLRQLAAGKTNRIIADEMVISEKTVARHVSNIFGKLGISSRSAATAYAYEHGLLDRST